MPETCNGRDDDLDGKADEGCSFALGKGTDPVLDKGRVAWLRPGDPSELWTATLPDPVPEFVTRGNYIRADVDADRLVYTDRERSGYVVVNMSTREERFVKPLDPTGLNLLTPSLEGSLLAYAQDLPIPCDGWCDETEVYLYDLNTEQTQRVASHSGTIQVSPILSASRMVWIDDRFGHHLDPVGYQHWFDVMTADLPYQGDFRRLTQAQPLSMQLLAFSGSRVLMNHNPAAGLDAFEVLDLSTNEKVDIGELWTQGDVLFDMSERDLVVRHDPLGNCGLRLIHLNTRKAVELDTQRRCPSAARVDGDFVVWSHQDGSVADLFWIDISEL